MKGLWLYMFLGCLQGKGWQCHFLAAPEWLVTWQCCENRVMLSQDGNNWVMYLRSCMWLEQLLLSCMGMLMNFEGFFLTSLVSIIVWPSKSERYSAIRSTIGSRSYMIHWIFNHLPYQQLCNVTMPPETNCSRFRVNVQMFSYDLYRHVIKHICNYYFFWPYSTCMFIIRGRYTCLQ